MNSVPDLSTATGASIRVALIDSGINAQHSHVGVVSGGIGFAAGADGGIETSNDYTDHIGHGTALAGILRAWAPRSELYAVKIFRERLATSITVLEAALRWAIERQMHMINLSLGTANPEHHERMRALVAQANASGILLVASSPPGRADVLPAALPGVIGVAGDERCGWGEYLYIAADPIHFRAHACPRPLPGPAQARNFRGHSFASAHISAVLALLLEKIPHLSFSEAEEYLKQTSRSTSL